MTSESSLPRQVLHLSGKDCKDVLVEFCGLLAASNAQLLHLTQNRVRGSLVISAEVAGVNKDALAKKALLFAGKRGLHLEVIPLSGPTASGGCGVWVTVLGDLSDSTIIAQVSTALQAHQLTLSRVESIGEGSFFGANILACKNSISRSELVAIRKTLLTLGAKISIDVAVQRDDVYRGSKRLICMDVDSTFVKGEFIDDLAELCNVRPQVAEITARAMRGELDFEAALRARVKLLKGLKMSQARELCDRFELTPGAEDLVKTAKQLGMRVGLVSGGFDFFVARLKNEFNLDFAFANELEVENDVLTGNVIGTVVDSHRKAQILKDMSHVFGIHLEQTIAAGDGANDIEMLQTAGLGIAYQAKPRLQEVAAGRINQNDRLDTLLYLMGYEAHKLFGDCPD